MEEKKVNIREMTMEDFEEVHALWMRKCSKTKER